MTEILFPALHISHVDFSCSRDISKFKDCSIRCATLRAFRKAFDHQLQTFSSSVITTLLLGICTVMQFCAFNGRIRVKRLFVTIRWQWYCETPGSIWIHKDYRDSQ